MTGLQNELEELEKQRDDLETRIRSRLEELDTERKFLQAKLAELGAPKKSPQQRELNGASRRRGVRSVVGKAVLRAVREAPKPLLAGEVVDTVRESFGEVERAAIMTQLSRFKQRGLLETEGEHGFLRYSITDAGREIEVS